MQDEVAGLITTNSTSGNNIQGLSVEDSKFLGGDVEHTHLVKGLDYALLQKVLSAKHLLWAPRNISI